METHAARRSSRAITLAAVVLLSTSTFTQAGTPITRVTGTYSYTSASGPKAVSVDAHLSDPVKGTWQFTNLASGVVREGPVTCLVVEGPDVWIAGPATTGDAGAFIYLRDEGSPGENDQAVTFIQDVDLGQLFEELQGWCQNQNTDVERYALDSGNVVIHASD